MIPPLLRTLPRAIKVGSSLIELRDLSSAQRAEELRGEFIPSERAICLDFTLPRGEAVETLLHEINHCIWATWRVKVAHGNEQVCAVYARALTEIFECNPRLVMWIAEALREGGK